MIIDLHCHTTASDGALAPDALLSRAAANGVELLSITDHDTLAAYTDLEVPPGLRLVPGIEFSCQWRERGLHIVGLDVDRHSAAMAEAESCQGRARTERAELIAEKLEKLGADSPLQGALEQAAGGTLGRPHFARHLVHTGFVRSVDQAFRKYLGNGKPCDIKVCWPGPERVIDWIRGAGGIAVLAHPGKYRFTRSWLVRCLEAFSSGGGQGMEVVSGIQNPVEIRQFAELCAKFGLHESAGSDFHGPDQYWLDLGRYSPLPAPRRPVWDLWQG